MSNLFEKVLQVKGFPLTEAKQQLQQIRQELESNSEDYSERKKWEIAKFHFDKNPHFRALLNGKFPENWSEIPIMTKQDLQKPLDERLSENYNKKDIFVNKTSGSSGNPFVFAKDKYAHALTWAHIIWLYSQYNIKMGSSLEARFYGIPKDFKGYYKERLKDFMANRFRLDIFDLSDKKLEGFLQRFQKKPFELLNGYTSSIVLFAKFLQKKNIVLKVVCPSLKVCITTSEMLFEKDKILLQKQLGIPIVNEYGASELDIIAFENPKGDWLVNNKTLFVEIVDDIGNVLPYGEEGAVVITSLYNQAHPFIRYKIGDIGVLDKKSTPQKPILKKLIGRTNQFALLPSGKKVPALSFYYVTKSVIEDAGLVKEIKIIQETTAEFHIEYCAEEDLSDAKKDKITKAIATYLEPGLKLKFKRFKQLERSKSGKLKQFISKVNQDA
ncbi:phenylacetate--CoA ligase family protein [Haloflavibacter putidus]|uniref:Phenylacetate--CoA ligase family protein n=1 Tax=Haloflavibacter putidus TaxID=2576776 RepID=A0A507ZW49_9FLAO|nr:phenylacetate--CoA ligase family protein [Haloflavibacter putidus]TQD40771.1 phenylacetate--CoA ligase family protein [Haloflavibacter putidus]